MLVKLFGVVKAMTKKVIGVFTVHEQNLLYEKYGTLSIHTTVIGRRDIESLLYHSLILKFYIFSRFGIINAVQAIQPVAKGEEFFASYSYSFDTAPPWYKDLLLQFMEQHPEERAIIQRASGGKSKAQLLEAYDKYLKLGPGATMSDLNMESTYKKDKESETKTDQPSFNI